MAAITIHLGKPSLKTVLITDGTDLRESPDRPCSVPLIPNGGHDDGQAQGYAGDRHDVVGLHGSLGLERRWAGWLESYQKKKGDKCILWYLSLCIGLRSLGGWL